MPDGGLFFWQVEIAEELLDGVDVYRTVHGIARAFLSQGWKQMRPVMPGNGFA